MTTRTYRLAALTGSAALGLSLMTCLPATADEPVDPPAAQPAASASPAPEAPAPQPSESENTPGTETAPAPVSEAAPAPGPKANEADTSEEPDDATPENTASDSTTPEDAAPEDAASGTGTNDPADSAAPEDSTTTESGDQADATPTKESATDEADPESEAAPSESEGPASTLANAMSSRSKQQPADSTDEDREEEASEEADTQAEQSVADALREAGLSDEDIELLADYGLGMSIEDLEDLSMEEFLEAFGIDDLDDMDDVELVDFTEDDLEDMLDLIDEVSSISSDREMAEFLLGARGGDFLDLAFGPDAATEFDAAVSSYLADGDQGSLVDWFMAWFGDSGASRADAQAFARDVVALLGEGKMPSREPKRPVVAHSAPTVAQVVAVAPKLKKPTTHQQHRAAVEPAAAEPAPKLAATGTEAFGPAGLGLLALAGGVVALGVARRRRA